MRTVRFYLEQSILHGSVAFGLLVVASTLINGRDVSSSVVVDTLVGLVSSWIFVLVFLSILATPIQLAARRLGTTPIRQVIAGVLSGFVAAALLIFFTGNAGANPSASLLLIVPLGLVGGWFSYSFRRHFGPN
jgi:uncharacterized membrane protein YgaE (UPF0421/DUF939 family)